MKVAFIDANSWEQHLPHITGDFNRKVWCTSDSATHMWPRAAMLAGVETVLYYLSSSITQPLDLQHEFGYRIRANPSHLHPGEFAREMSLRLLRELSCEKFDMLLCYQHYRNGRYPDMFDLFAFHCISCRAGLTSRARGSMISVSQRQAYAAVTGERPQSGQGATESGGSS